MTLTEGNAVQDVSGLGLEMMVVMNLKIKSLVHTDSEVQEFVVDELEDRILVNAGICG